MKNTIKKSLNVSRQLRDLNKNVQHKLYIMKKSLSNVDKQYKAVDKIRNFTAFAIVVIYVIQNIYHLSFNGFNTNYVIDVFTLGILYLPIAYIIKNGFSD